MKARAEQGADEGVWIRAETQNGGIGRLGRKWESPKGNLFCSGLADIRTGDPISSSLSFVAALAVFETIRSYLPETEMQLKWPHDVLVSGAKICGMLYGTRPRNPRGSMRNECVRADHQPLWLRPAEHAPPTAHLSKDKRPAPPKTPWQNHSACQTAQTALPRRPSQWPTPRAATHIRHDCDGPARTSLRQLSAWPRRTWHRLCGPQTPPWRCRRPHRRSKALRCSLAPFCSSQARPVDLRIFSQFRSPRAWPLRIVFT